MTKKEAKALLQKNVGKFYVYELLRPTGEAFYVGKGTVHEKGKPRLFCHEKPDKCNLLKSNIIKKIVRSGNKVRYKICEFFDDESDALALEIELIAKYGRRDKETGILANMTDGGEGCCGATFTKEMRIERSEQTTRYFIEHPEAITALSEKRKEWIKKYPKEELERRKKSAEASRTKESRSISRKATLLFYEEHPEMKEHLAKKSKEWIEDNPGAELRFVEWAKNKPEEFKETRKKSAETHKTEEYRIKCSEQKKEWWEAHPEARELQSARVKQWRKDNPEEYLESLKNSIETHRTEEFKEVARKRSCDWIKNNPEKVDEIINKTRKTLRTKASRERNSAQRKEWFGKHPEERDVVSSRIKKWQKENPEKFKQATAKSLATRAKRTAIRLKCLAIIKNSGLSIKAPSGNDALSVWKNFEIELISGAENTLAGGGCESRRIPASAPILTTGEVLIS